MGGTFRGCRCAAADSTNLNGTLGYADPADRNGSATSAGVDDGERPVALKVQRNMDWHVGENRAHSSENKC